jgi:hypothetical protein
MGALFQDRLTVGRNIKLRLGLVSCGIFAAGKDIVKIRYQVTTSDDIEGWMCAAVTVVF